MKGHNYSKGTWVPNKYRQIMCDDKVICYIGMSGHMADNEDGPNAQLIAAAVNACIAVNPDNPMAVAESIKDMCEALKHTKIVLGNLRTCNLGELTQQQALLDMEINKTLAKAGRKETS